MNTIVENLELRKNNFSKWFSAIMLLVSIAGLFITIKTNHKSKWWMPAVVVVFGGMFYSNLRNKICVSQQGLLIRAMFKKKEILWGEITSLKYETEYIGPDLQLIFTIKYGSPSKSEVVHVNQYKKAQMQRFFEMLNEQCPFAEKNELFIKQASGEMNWKNKPKMY